MNNQQTTCLSMKTSGTYKTTSNPGGSPGLFRVVPAMFFRLPSVVSAFMLCASAPAFSLEAWVAPYKGRNVFFVDGKPIPPLMYSGTEQGRETWKDPAHKCIREFADKGYRIFQTDFWLKYSLPETGELDVQGIRKQLRGILDAAPEAIIFARINVSAPGWWLKRHPDETCKVTKPGPDNDQFAGNRAESLASEKYRGFARDGLRLFLKALAGMPEGERIAGIHIGGGVYGEWHYYGIFNEPDASEPMRREFIRHAKARHETIGELNASWKTTFDAFESIEVPDFERRSQAADGEFFDPEQDGQVIDYYDYQQQVVSSLLEDLARLTRETWPRRVIIGAFYGYFYGGFTVGAQAGQNDIARIFRSPYLDYFAAPYFSRSMHGSGMFRSLAESAALNGKIWMTEHDGGTHLGSSGSGTGKFPDIPADEAQTVARMRRTFMHSLTERGGQWWYDFGPCSQGGGWWSTPRLMKEAGELLKLSEQLMEVPFEKHADVLVVHDMETYHLTPPARIGRFAGKANEDLADALLGTGASFDKIFLMDLGKVDLAKYKLVVFANNVRMTGAGRAFVRGKVMVPGRTVVFLGPCGYSDGTKNDVRLVSDLTGIKVTKLRGADHIDVRLKGHSSRIPAQKLKSVFGVDDKEAVTAGTYDGGGAGVASKTVNGCRVWFFGVPPGKDAPLLRHLFSQAGVRFFVDAAEAGDVISVGGGIVGIYSVKGGNRVVRPLDAGAVEVRLSPYSTVFLDIGTGRVLSGG